MSQDKTKRMEWSSTEPNKIRTLLPRPQLPRYVAGDGTRTTGPVKAVPIPPARSAGQSLLPQWSSVPAELLPWQTRASPQLKRPLAIQLKFSPLGYF